MTLNRWIPGLFERCLKSGGGESRSVSDATSEAPPEGE